MMPGFTTAMPEGSEISMLGDDGVLRIISLPDGRVTGMPNFRSVQHQLFAALNPSLESIDSLHSARVKQMH